MCQKTAENEVMAAGRITKDTEDGEASRDSNAQVKVYATLDVEEGKLVRSLRKKCSNHARAR